MSPLQDSFGLSVATTAAIDAATDSNCASDYLYVSRHLQGNRGLSSNASK